MEELYKDKFYKNRHQRTVDSARAIVPLVLGILPPITSAIDFGCGVGTWLSVLREQGVTEVQGLDGPWVDQTLLEIPRENFRQVNFEEPIELGRRYDLAMTLEVAEHISPQNAGQFIASLTKAADFIFFSAAIPYQGGLGHVNEQWPDYWAQLFSAEGYAAVDLLRPQLWTDARVLNWYRQNVMLFIKKERLDEISSATAPVNDESPPLALVHPERYIAKIEKMSTLKGSWRLFRRALKKDLKERFGGQR